MNNVIAVASIIGGGKTSFVNALAEALEDAATIHYDHYEKVTKESTNNLLQWIRNGADFNDFIIPQLPDDLARLKQGKPVIDPLTGIETKAKKHIIFEMPLGKAHRLTAAHIDLLIWIETPFDVALARKIKEFTGSFLTERVDYKDSIVWLDGYLGNYLDIVREVLQIQKEKVSVDADIVIDGRNGLTTMVREAVHQIFDRIPG
jgi:uridine kinase